MINYKRVFVDYGDIMDMLSCINYMDILDKFGYYGYYGYYSDSSIFVYCHVLCTIIVNETRTFINIV